MRLRWIDLLTRVEFRLAGMIMGASASSVWYNLQVSHPTKEAPVLDYKLALLFQPMLMLAITIGVELSVVFPYWFITILIIILFVGLCAWEVLPKRVLKQGSDFCAGFL